MGVNSSALSSRTTAPIAPQGECGTGKYWLDEFRRNPSSVGNISITDARYMKCSEGWEHEFLVLTLNDKSRPSHRCYAIVERQNPLLDDPNPPETERLRAADNIVMYHDSTFSCRPELIKTLRFLKFTDSEFTLEKLIVLANTVSKNTPEYNTIHSQCFWYASSIWAVVKLEFSPEETVTELAHFQGTSRVFKVPLGHGPGVAEERSPIRIRSEYHSAWNQFDRDIGIIRRVIIRYLVIVLRSHLLNRN